jgi:hypothetical protein
VEKVFKKRYTTNSIVIILTKYEKLFSKILIEFVNVIDTSKGSNDFYP